MEEIELISLYDPPSFAPNQTISGWESLDWSERYIDASDFKLTTRRVKETMAALPLDSFVSLSDSREVMIVDSHEVNMGSDGKDVLTVSGQSAEVFLENRSALSDPEYQGSYTGSPILWFPAMNLMTPDQIAEMMMYSSVVNSNFFHEQPQFVLPGVRITHNATTSTEDLDFDMLGNGDLYSVVLSLLLDSKMGLRARRADGSSEPVVSFSTSSPERIITNTTLSEGLMFDVYSGINRTGTVVLDQGAGDFSSFRLLRSNREFKNASETYNSPGDAGNTNFKKLFSRNQQPLKQGWELKSQILEFQEENLTVARARRRSRRELRKNFRKTRLNEFELNPYSTNYKFGTDYNLGDRVNAMTNYGAIETLHVMEHTRSMGINGYTTRTLLGDLE